MTQLNFIGNFQVGEIFNFRILIYCVVCGGKIISLHEAYEPEFI